ncbi:MAG: PAS domain S-box protein [Ktedonobacteraceae bacterium]|nr:PAS domain S-box protein [Ktedonobacteraceae bacterium]
MGIDQSPINGQPSASPGDIAGSHLTLQVPAAILDRVHDAILVYDNEHRRLVSWNRGAEALYGWSAREAIGQNISNLLHPRVLYADAQCQQLPHNSISWQEKSLRTCRSGKQVIVESCCFLLRDATTGSLFVMETNHDMTARSRGEQAYKERIQFALKAAEAFLWQWDLKADGNLTFFETVPDTLDLSSGTSITYEQFVNNILPDDRQQTIQAMQRAIQNGTDYAHEYRVFSSEKGIRWMSARGRVFRDEQGNAECIAGITTDITERKQTEEALKAANRQITETLESIADGCIHLDTSWRCIYVNRRTEEITGMPLEALYGQVLWDLFPELGGETAEQLAQQAMETQQPVRFETLYEPTVRWFQVHLHPFPDHLVVYYRDISDIKSEIKRLEMGMQEYRQLFHRLVDTNLIGAIICDAQGTVIEANDAFLSMLGYSQEDVTAGLLTYQNLTPPEYAALDAQALEELKTQRASRPYEKAYYNKQHQLVPVLVVAARLGTSAQSIGLIVDMSAQKELEKQKETLMSMVSHELRTPLTAINGSMQLIQRRLHRFRQAHQELLPDVQKLLNGLEQLVEQSLRQTRVQDRLINDLLDASRIAVNKLHLSLHPCDLVSIVRETVEDLRYIEGNHPIELELPPQQSIILLADSTRISQVVGNYISNALKYSPIEAPVKVGITVLEKEVRVWVQDQGPGLSAEAQKHIWDRFYRVSDVNGHTSSANLGLGLYICQTLIQRHRGSVGVESQPGKGSTFWFSLPLPEASLS